MSDLLTSANQNSIAEVDFSLWKIVAIVFLGVFSAIGFSYFLYGFLIDWSGGIYALVCLVFFLVAIFLEAVFIKDFSRLVTAIFFEVLAIGTFSYIHFSGFLFGALIVAFFFLLWGCWRGRDELQYNLKIRIFSVNRVLLPKVITAVSLFVVAAYVGVYDPQKTLISPDIFDKVVMPTQGIVKYFYPISFSGKFGDAVQTVVEKQLEGQMAYKRLPDSDKAAIRKQAGDDLKARVADYIGVWPNDNERVIDVMYRAFVQFSGGLSGDQKNFVFAGLALALFLVVRSIGIPIMWVTYAVSALIYETLLAAGFAELVLESRSKEIII